MNTHSYNNSSHSLISEQNRNFDYSNNYDYSDSNRMSEKQFVPIWEKMNLSLNEAASYFGIGINKIREITNDENCAFVLWVGNRRLIKRALMEEYLSKMYSI